MTISNIFTVIARNLKVYSNSKLSSLIIILGPLMLMLIIGVSLQDNSLKNIQAGIFSSDSGDLSDNFINLLKEKGFNINIEETLEKCKKDVIEEINHVCIHLKKNEIGLEQISSNYKSYDIDIYVDFSKQRVVWDIIGSIQGIVEQESYSTRRTIIRDINDKIGDLDSRIILVENGLNNALAITSSLKQESLDTTGDLNSLKLIFSNTKNLLKIYKMQKYW
jgi:hypothetical protein